MIYCPSARKNLNAIIDSRHQHRELKFTFRQSQTPRRNLTRYLWPTSLLSQVSNYGIKRNFASPTDTGGVVCSSLKCPSGELASRMNRLADLRLAERESSVVGWVAPIRLKGAPCGRARTGLATTATSCAIPAT